MRYPKLANYICSIEGGIIAPSIANSGCRWIWTVSRDRTAVTDSRMQSSATCEQQNVEPQVSILLWPLFESHICLKIDTFMDLS